MISTNPANTSRRAFLSASALAGTGLLLPSLAVSVVTAGANPLRVGLIGCGGRGTVAASQAFRNFLDVKLVAMMGDMFKDRLDGNLAALQRGDSIAKKIVVKPETCFVGFDAYKKFLDVVLLTTPPAFVRSPFERPSRRASTCSGRLTPTARTPRTTWTRTSAASSPPSAPANGSSRQREEVEGWHHERGPARWPATIQ